MIGLVRAARRGAVLACVALLASSCGDNERALVLEFTTLTSSGNEGTTVTVAVQVSQAPDQDLTVMLTTGGSSTAIADYEPLPTPLTIAAGTTGGNLSIQLKNDDAVEPEETLSVTLTAPTGARLGDAITHTVRIVDVPPMAASLQFADAVGVGDETTPGMADVVRMGSPSGAARVNYTVTGGSASPTLDFAVASGVVNFNDGETRKSIALGVVADTLDEPDETIVLGLTGPSGATLGLNTVHTYTIRGRMLPRVNFGTPTSSMSETVTSRTIPITLSAASAQTVTVNFTVGGSATGGGVDHSLAAGIVTFAPGEMTKTIALPVINDATDEPDETVIITLTGANLSALLGTTTEHTATIEDDDGPPSVAFQLAASSSPEPTALPTINVVLSAESGKPVTVDFSRTGGSAGVLDFGLSAVQITFAPGETSRSIPIMVSNDGLDEDDETVVLTLGATPVNATLGAPASHTLTIVDEDATPTVEFSVMSSQSGEGNGIATIVVTLSAQSGRTVTANYAVSGGSATGGGVDYTLAPGTLTFDPLDTTQNITVTLVADGVNEGNETIVVNLTSANNATLGAVRPHTLTLLDNLILPTVQFAVDASSGSEATSPANLLVTLSQSTTQTVTVSYTIRGVTASAGSDFTAGTGNVMFTPGQTSRTIPVTIANDNLDEVDETLEVELMNPSNAVLGGFTSHTYTIIDNDDTPIVGFTSATYADLESVSGRLTLRLSRQSSSMVAVSFVVTGGTANGPAAPLDVDYTLQSGMAIIPPNTDEVDVPVGVVNDSLHENNETITVHISGAVNANVGQMDTTYTITDQDLAPLMEFIAVPTGGLENAPALVRVRLSARSALDASGTLAVGVASTATRNVDYTLTATVTVPAGSTDAFIPLTILDDQLDEPDENILLVLGAPFTEARAGTNLTHGYTIQDQDDPPMIHFEEPGTSMGNEVAGPVSVNVVLTGASGRTITVLVSATGGTATQGAVAPADYTFAATTLTFVPGDTSESFSFTIRDDSTLEPNETVIFGLSAASNAGIGGGTTTHTHTIVDNDSGPTVGFNAGNMSASETVGGVLQIRLSALSGVLTTVDYSIGGGTATGPLGAHPDYALVNGTAMIPAGMMGVDVPIGVVNDDFDEDNETIFVTLTNATNATVGSGPLLFGSTTYSIADEDATPTVGFAAGTSSVNEDTATSIAINMSAVSGRDVSIVVGALSVGTGADWTAGGTVMIPAFTMPATVAAPLTVTVDSIDEVNENVMLRLTGATNATVDLPNRDHVRTIVDDDDAPTFSFTTNMSGDPESTTMVSIEVTKVGSTERTFMVGYADSGTGTAVVVTDYIAIPVGTLTFGPATLTQNIMFTVVNDSVFEADNTVVLGLTGVMPSDATIVAPSTHTYTIENDDPMIVTP